jgi:hypothetical protein
MEDRFQDLQNEIYKDDEELRLFRQLIVNIIMATGKTVDSITNFNFNCFVSASFSPQVSFLLLYRFRAIFAIKN